MNGAFHARWTDKLFKRIVVLIRNRFSIALRSGGPIGHPLRDMSSVGFKYAEIQGRGFVRRAFTSPKTAGDVPDNGVVSAIGNTT